ARATEGQGIVGARLLLLQGIDTGLPTAGGRGGRGGPGTGTSERGSAVLARTVAIAAEPAALTRLAAADSDAGKIAKSIASKIEWPGKPASVVDVAPLTAKQPTRLTSGAELMKHIS